ncbi:MAG TPA: hypothetical protein VF807_02480 [Ktedonobacterales bacterium]|jgi:hypothetical protein
MKALGAILALLGIAVIGLGAFRHFNNVLFPGASYYTLVIIGVGVVLLVLGAILANRDENAS